MKKILVATFVAVAAIVLTGCGSQQPVIVQVPGPTVTATPEAPAPPAASAFTATEQAFIDFLNQNSPGLVSKSEEADVVSVGHSVCQLLDQSDSVVEAALTAVRAGTEAGFTQDQSTLIVGASIGYFCPQYLGEISAATGI